MFAFFFAYSVSKFSSVFICISRWRTVSNYAPPFVPICCPLCSCALCPSILVITKTWSSVICLAVMASFNPPQSLIMLEHVITKDRNAFILLYLLELIAKFNLLSQFCHLWTGAICWRVRCLWSRHHWNRIWGSRVLSDHSQGACQRLLTWVLQNVNGNQEFDCCKVRS
jgi:hypothetical protein